MLYQTLNHHLILMLKRFLDEKFSESGYQVVVNPENYHLNIKDGSSIPFKPALAVYGDDSSMPLMLADLDLQACGRQEYFTEKIQQYENSSVKEHWLFYTKDHIVVVRRKENDQFLKPVIYEESELFRRGGLFPEFHRI
ncbi:MAG: hypothetical protein OEZ34_06620 [Spirochaetia bacterium]|nr:hypothetical protein [Spirochaetia bacterium]